MAGSVNRAFILGHLGKDPEIRATNNSRVANFSIATTESWRDKSSGEKKEKTEWHRITVWGDALVDVIDKYVHKGDKIYIEGKIETRKWTDRRDNTERYATEIVVKGFDGKIILLADPRRSASAGGNGRLADREPGDEAGGAGGYEQPRNRNDDLDDEIPFVSSDVAAEPYLKRRAVL